MGRCFQTGLALESTDLVQRPVLPSAAGNTRCPESLKGTKRQMKKEFASFFRCLAQAVISLHIFSLDWGFPSSALGSQTLGCGITPLTLFGLQVAGNRR